AAGLCIQPAPQRQGGARRQWRLSAGGGGGGVMKTAVDSYPSRGECAPGIQPRHDPVVYAREDGETAPIPRERVDAYARDGFLILEELFTPEEVAGLQAELLQLRNDPLLRRRDEAVTEPDSGALRSIFRVHELS